MLKMMHERDASEAAEIKSQERIEAMEKVVEAAAWHREVERFQWFIDQYIDSDKHSADWPKRINVAGLCELDGIRFFACEDLDDALAALPKVEG